MKRLIILAAILIIISLSPRAFFAQSLPPCSYNIRVLSGAMIDPDDITTFDTAITDSMDGDVVCLGPTTVNPTIWNNLGEDPSGFPTHGVKHIEIRGYGTMPSMGSAGQTVVTLNTRGGNPPGSVFNGREGPAGTGNIVIDNIKFIIPDDAGIGSSDFSNGVIAWQSTTNGIPWILHHIDFDISPFDCNYDIKLIHPTTNHGGIVYASTLTNHPKASCNYGTTNQEAIRLDSSDSGVASWTSVSTFGSADTTGTANFYFDNNHATNFSVLVNRNEGSRSVFRFNTFTNSSLTDHGFDSGAQGIRHSEVYNNTFLCVPTMALTTWVGAGGSEKIFNNTYPVASPSTCNFGGSGTIPNSKIGIRKLQEAFNIGTWPGNYMDTYPVSHQPGWGYLTGCPSSPCINVGSATKQGQPGGSGFNQALEPTYWANNTGNSSSTVDVITGYLNDGVIFTSSTTDKTSGTQLCQSQYASSGMDLIAVFADLVGSSAPTIDDDEGPLTWTALNGGTNGSTRLSAWRARTTSDAVINVCVHFGSSSAARALVLSGFRNLASSPIDKNPSTTNYTAQTNFDAPLTGTLTQPDMTHTCPDGIMASMNQCEVVLGYFAVNGPIASYVPTSNAAGYASDSYTTSDGIPDNPSANKTSVAWHNISGIEDTSINGTSGGMATSNVTVGLLYKYVTVNTSTRTTLIVGTARDAVAGTVSLIQNGDPQLEVTDFFVADREYYDQAGGYTSPCQTGANTPFDGSTGTGCGTASDMAAVTTCTQGTGFWVTNEGSWNMSGSGGQGRLYICGASNNFTLSYTPYVYPYCSGPNTPSTDVAACVTGSSPSPTVNKSNPKGFFLVP